MANRRRAAAPPGGPTDALMRSPEAVDRILMVVCALIWLAALGVSVAATVVLFNLGSAAEAASAESDTPWLLYTVIGVSALVIVGSIPLLLRARSTAGAPARRSTPRVVAAPESGTRTTDPATEKLQAFGAAAAAPRTRTGAAVLASAPPRGASAEVVDRIMLRCTVLLVGAIGLGLVVVATSTYLMGVNSDTAAWAALGVAAVVTLAMPVIPFRYLGKLREVTDALAGA